VVIADNQILGIYGSDREAYDETLKTRARKSFMIKYIPVNPEDEIDYIYSPVFEMAHG
jgi:hypothetical protein